MVEIIFHSFTTELPNVNFFFIIIKNFSKGLYWGFPSNARQNSLDKQVIFSNIETEGFSCFEGIKCLHTGKSSNCTETASKINNKFKIKNLKKILYHVGIMNGITDC